MKTLAWALSCGFALAVVSLLWCTRSHAVAEPVGSGLASVALVSAEAGTVGPVYAPTSTWMLVTPDNACGMGVPGDWALLKTGKGLMVWASPATYKALEPK
jgi:hypothetical protein